MRRVEKEKVEPDFHDFTMGDRNVGFVNFKRFKGRDPFYKMSGVEPHEKRFEAFIMSPRSTNFLRPVTTDFKKQLPRDDKLNTVMLTPSTFDGNIEAILPAQKKLLVGFEKIPQRKPINNINKAVTGDSTVHDNIDKYYAS
jgi:hypothetical protein